MCSLASSVQVESFQYLLLILGFWFPLESIIGICQHIDQSCTNESQGSHYVAEKYEKADRPNLLGYFWEISQLFEVFSIWR